MVRIGTVGQYNTPGTTQAHFNHADVVEKSLRIQGFLVSHYRDLQEELYEFAVPHLRGGNTGKILVRAAS